MDALLRAGAFVLGLTCAGRCAGQGAEVINLGYVANTVSNSISVVDTATNAVVEEIAVDGAVRDADVGPGGRFVFVSTRAPDRVVMIDLTDRRVVARIDGVGGLPDALACSPDGRRVYVSSFADNLVSIIDPAIGAVVGQLPVGSAPNDIAISPDGRVVYVTNHFSDTVSVIDHARGTTLADIAVGSFPISVAFTPDGRRAYVANFFSQDVTVIDATTHTALGRIGLQRQNRDPPLPSSVSMSPDGARVYVSSIAGGDVSAGSVSVIATATNQVVTTIDGLGRFPSELAVSPRGDCVYVNRFVTNADRSAASGTVAVIETASNTVAPEVIPVGALPLSFKFPTVCLGDCSGDGQVTVDELVRGVGLLLDGAAPDACAALDVDRDGVITVAELVTSVDRALNGCAPEVQAPAALARPAPHGAGAEQCGAAACPAGQICVRDLDCHLRGCAPRDTCCAPDDLGCGPSPP